MHRPSAPFVPSKKKEKQAHRCFPLNTPEPAAPLAETAARRAACYRDAMLTPPLLWTEAGVDFEAVYGAELYTCGLHHHRLCVCM